MADPNLAQILTEKAWYIGQYVASVLSGLFSPIVLNLQLIQNAASQEFKFHCSSSQLIIWPTVPIPVQRRRSSLPMGAYFAFWSILPLQVTKLKACLRGLFIETVLAVPRHTWTQHFQRGSMFLGLLQSLPLIS